MTGNHYDDVVRVPRGARRNQKIQNVPVKALKKMIEGKDLFVSNLAFDEWSKRQKLGLLVTNY